MQNTKYKILKALFTEAAKLGIDQETLRETIAPAVINKRLSMAAPQEVARVLVHIHNKHGIPETTDYTDYTEKKRYEPSRKGLLLEVADLAKQRFGEDYVRPHNALC